METSRIIERISNPASFSNVKFAMPGRFPAFSHNLSAFGKPIYILKPVSCQRLIHDDFSSLDNFSTLPFELVAQILEEYLDLESMMCIAGVNSALCELVSLLSLVKRIRELKELALPFVLLQNT
jgi:hypothetical protein